MLLKYKKKHLNNYSYLSGIDSKTSQHFKNRYVTLARRPPTPLSVTYFMEDDLYKITWLNQNLSSRFFDEFKEFGCMTVSGREFQGSVALRDFLLYLYLAFM